MNRCPFCSSEIEENTTICRFCFRELSNTDKDFHKEIQPHNFCSYCGYEQEIPFIFCPQCGQKKGEHPKQKSLDPTNGKVFLIVLGWIAAAIGASFLGAMVALFIGMYDACGGSIALWSILIIGLKRNWNQPRIRNSLLIMIAAPYLIGILIWLYNSNEPISSPTVRPTLTRLISPSTPYVPNWNAPSRVPTQVSQGGCILWSDVTASMEGQKKCVFGYLVTQYQADYGTYLRFSNDDTSFYFLHPNQGDYYVEYEMKPGDCVQGEGIVKEYQGIPRIEVTGLKNCN